MTLTHDELTALDQVPAGAVVVGLDGSPAADLALDWAAEQAAVDARSLVLAHALGRPPSWSGWASADPARARQALLGGASVVLDGAMARAARRLHGRVGVDVVRMMRLTSPHELLVELSERAAYVVLGSRGRGPLRSVLQGSTGVAVVRQAACPVVVHRPAHPGRVRRGVVVEDDDSPAGRDALEVAQRIATARGLPLRTVRGCGGRALTDLSADAHLLVLGARGAVSVLEHASCPVVVVRSPGHS